MNNYPNNKYALATKTGDDIVVKFKNIFFMIKPLPLAKPEISRELTSMMFIERVAEIMRFYIATLEYTLSPNGGLRFWIKTLLLLALIIGCPFLVFYPIISLFGNFLTYTLSFGVSIAVTLAKISMNILIASLSFLLTLLITILIMLTIKLIITLMIFLYRR